MADELPDVVERFVADVGDYVRNLERAAREADEFGEQNAEARESVRRMGMAAEEAGERAADAQREAAREAERLAEGTGDVEKAARAAARAQRELEKAEIAQARAARAAAAAADREADQYAELAREATRAAAAQRLAQLAASGNIEEHNQLVRRLREEYGDLGDDGSGAFREITRGASRGAMALAGMATKVSGVAPMLLALPAAAMLAGSGIVLGVGAALSAIPALVAAQNDEVKAEYSDLKDHVVGSLKEWAEPWEDTLIDLKGAAQDVFDYFGPTLRGVFRDLAPEVEVFGKQTLGALREFRPMIEDFSHAFQAVIRELGPEMDDIFRNVADGLSEIADAVAENPEQLGQLLSDLSALATLAGQITALLIRLYPVINATSGAWDSVADATGGAMPYLEKILGWLMAVSNPISLAKASFDGIGGAIDMMRGKSDEATGSMDTVNLATTRVSQALSLATVHAQGMQKAQSANAQIMDLAKQSADKLKASLDALAGKTLTSRDAAINYGAAVDAMTASIKENGRAHGFSTEKGRQNESALNALVVAAHENAVAMRDSGASAREVGAHMAGARKRVIDAARAMGYNQKEAVQLADKLFGVRNAAKSIPNKEHVDVTASTGQARAEINRLIAETHNRVINVVIRTLGGYAGGGLVHGFADGGHVGEAVRRFPTGGSVRGPGSGTSDSIPAMLSNGEFVVNARATREFLPLLKAINGRRRSAPVPPVAAAHPAAGGAVTIVNNHWHIAGTVVAERQLLDLVQKQANKRNQRNPGTALFGSRG